MTLLIFLLIIISLGAYTLLSLNTKGWRRWASPVFLAGVYGLLITAFLYSSGQCRPTWLGFMNRQMVVTSAEFAENVAIYVWGHEQGNEKPVCVALPWSLVKAKKMNELQIDGVDWELRPEDGDLYPHPKSPQPLPPKVLP